MKKRSIFLVLVFTLVISLATISFGVRDDDIPRVFSVGSVIEQTETLDHVVE